MEILPGRILTWAGFRRVFLCPVIAICTFLVPVVAVAASSACDVRLSQATLRALEFDPGPVDGVWGNSTATAVHAFQSTNNIALTDILDEPTCDALSVERNRGIAYQKYLEPVTEAGQSYIVRRNWCGVEEYRMRCSAGEAMRISGVLAMCGSTLKHFKEEVGGGMIFSGTHSGVETACRSLDDFCTYALAAFGNAFGDTCDGREELNEKACKSKLMSVCDQ